MGKTAVDNAWKIYECFWGELVLGRTLPDADELAANLAKQALRDYDGMNIHRITTMLKAEGEYTLLLVELESTPHSAGLNNMVMGLWDDDAKAFVGETYIMGGDSADYTS